jgi:hypothetical protein
MDDVTANTVMYAVRLLAADSEAHAREIRAVGATLRRTPMARATAT